MARAAPGNRYCESGKLTEVGYSGYGWALTIHSDNAHSLNFNAGGFNPNGYYRRAYGLPLRCLQEKGEKPARPRASATADIITDTVHCGALATTEPVGLRPLRIPMSTTYAFVST